MTDAIASTAATAKNTAPLTIALTFSDISVRNRANSCRNRSAASRIASATSVWRLAPCRSDITGLSGARATGRAAAAACRRPPGAGFGHALRRALDEPRQQEPGHERDGPDSHWPVAGEGLDVVVDFLKASFADRAGELLEAIGGALDERANVLLVLKGFARLPERRREVRDRLRRIVLAAVGVGRGFVACTGEQRAAPVPRRACEIACGPGEIDGVVAGLRSLLRDVCNLGAESVARGCRAPGGRPPSALKRLAHNISLGDNLMSGVTFSLSAGSRTAALCES